MNQTVAIFGATGAQGAPVVSEALNKGLNVRAVARDAAKVGALHPAANAISASFDNKDSLVAALDGVDAAFVHLPMPQSPEDPARWMQNFFEAAHQVKLPLLVYTTSASTGDRYPSSPLIDASTQGMQAVLNSGIPAIVLQPSIYLENLHIDPFLPHLKTQGVLDYPPVPESLKVSWTSHHDQARIAVAALTRPDLAGQSFEVATPGAVTGAQLADLLKGYAGQNVRFAPITPAEFGQRVADVLQSPATGFALTDLYSTLSSMAPDALTIDTDAIEALFGVTLTSIEDHLRSWAPVDA